MASVDITNINKVQLLQALWRHSKPASILISMGLSTDFDENLANDAVKGYIDYFCGRAIKTDISTDIVEVDYYDRYNGQGRFQKVVNTLK